MRLLHTSDWHLGAWLGAVSREPDHQQFLDWLVPMDSPIRIPVHSQHPRKQMTLPRDAVLQDLCSDLLLHLVLHPSVSLASESLQGEYPPPSSGKLRLHRLALHLILPLVSQLRENQTLQTVQPI